MSAPARHRVGSNERLQLAQRLAGKACHSMGIGAKAVYSPGLRESARRLDPDRRGSPRRNREHTGRRGIPAHRAAACAAGPSRRPCQRHQSRRNRDPEWRRHLGIPQTGRLGDPRSRSRLDPGGARLSGRGLRHLPGLERAVRAPLRSRDAGPAGSHPAKAEAAR